MENNISHKIFIALMMGSGDAQPLNKPMVWAQPATHFEMDYLL